MFGCSKCDNRWGGYNTAHCAACHLTFTSIEGFDKHRQGSHAKDTRHCVPPESVGLEQDPSRGYKCYRRSPRPSSQAQARSTAWGAGFCGTCSGSRYGGCPMSMNDDRDPLQEAVYRVCEYGGAPPITIDIPEGAVIKLADGHGPLLEDASIWWVD